MRLTTDREIRVALHRKTLKRLHECPNTLVIDELGLAHAKARIDIAVINGCVHGYEIKSALDTLDRLPNQLLLYEECLEKLTIVCAEKHLRDVQKMAPTWCGLLKASKGPRGGINFTAIRAPRRNPNVQAHRLAHLLWRPEAAELLSRFDTSRNVLRMPRKQLYECLSELLTIEQITPLIREFMTARQEWRRLPARA